MIWKLMASKPEYAFTCTHTQSDGQAENSLQAHACNRQRHKTNPANHLFIMAITQVILH